MHVIYIISGAWIDMNEQKERILKGTIQAFNEKGLKFTMDDLARILGMSKKTIYVEFTDKNSLFLAMVDYLFDGIKESEEEIINNTDIDIVDKITTMLGVLPESYKDIDLRQLYMLKDKYPVIYKRVEERFENGWQQTIELLKEAKEWGQYGICVNIVLPGAESPAAKAWAEKFPEEYAKQVNLNPMKRFGDPENDIAPVIAFLAGPDSCYFSGQSVIVDGANSIMP